MEDIFISRLNWNLETPNPDGTVTWVEIDLDTLTEEIPVGCKIMVYNHATCEYEGYPSLETARARSEEHKAEIRRILA